MISSLEIEFENMWTLFYPDIDLETEVHLIPKRKFRFDYVHQPSKVAIEINGGIYGKGGHSSIKGIQRDYEKNNLAQSLGYSVFYLSRNMINPEWLTIIAETIKQRGHHE